MSKDFKVNIYTEDDQPITEKALVKQYFYDIGTYINFRRIEAFASPCV